VKKIIECERSQIALPRSLIVALRRTHIDWRNITSSRIKRESKTKTVSHSPVAQPEAYRHSGCGKNPKKATKEGLWEYVGVLEGSGNVEDTNVPKSNPLVDKVEIDLDMLCALVLDQIRREVNSTDIVAVDNGGVTKGLVKFLK
jgi:hypothetical protein